ncbi:hypothetical protein Tco_0964075 [Tanacetum coccineum]
MAHVYKVEAKETDQVDVYFGLMGRNLQITVTLKKEERMQLGGIPLGGYVVSTHCISCNSHKDELQLASGTYDENWHEYDLLDRS